MEKLTHFFEKFREEHYFRYINAVGYLPITFLRTESKIDVSNEKRTVMKPTPGSYALAKIWYKQASQHFNDPDIMTEFSKNYDNVNSLYTAKPFPALRFTRGVIEQYKGKSVNVSIENIGAEYVDGVGIQDPLHTLELYRIVDSDYEIHYALSTSLSMLEIKSNELNNAEKFIYSNDDMFDETKFNINMKTLSDFVVGLAQDYFSDYIGNNKTTDVLLLNPNTTDFDVLGVASPELLNQNDKNIRIGIVLLTNEPYSLPKSFRN